MEIPSRLLKCVMLAAPEDEMAGTISFASLTDAAAIDMEERGAQHREFIVENGETVVKTHRIFRKHFNIVHHGYVACAIVMMSCHE
jgi:hypothetical protein